MHFTVPPEMFTSITDLIDAIAAVAFLIVLRRDKSTVARLWKVVMLSLAIGGIMGFTVQSRMLYG